MSKFLFLFVVSALMFFAPNAEAKHHNPKPWAKSETAGSVLVEKQERPVMVKPWATQPATPKCRYKCRGKFFEPKPITK